MKTFLILIIVVFLFAAFLIPKVSAKIFHLVRADALKFKGTYFYVNGHNKDVKGLISCLPKNLNGYRIKKTLATSGDISDLEELVVD